MLKKISRFPIYPLLLGLYPVFYLWAANLGQTTPRAVIYSMLVGLVYALVVFGVALAAARRLDKAGALAGWFLLLSLLYGNGYNLIKGRLLLGLEIGYLRLLLLFGLLFLVVGVFILRARRSYSNLTVWANLLISVLILFSLARIIPYESRVSASQNRKDAPAVQVSPADPSAPDIYYIILDGYTRSDALLELEGYDNSAFIQGLQQRGFYVAECAFSNYPSTFVSIASALNMTYLEDLGFMDENILFKDKPAELLDVTYHNQVRRVLAQHGYQFAALRGFAPINDIQDADYYFEYYDAKSWDKALETRNFEYMYLNTTFFRALVELYEQRTEAPIWEKLPAPLYAMINPDGEKFFSRSYAWYGQSMYAFETLENFPTLPGNKFFYAHIYATHQPFVLRADGSFPWPIDENYDGFIPAVEYVSGRILQTMDVILEKSAVPPVIILQGDHGIGEGVNLNKILNAYYLPRGNQSLYPTITPVNSLRLVLREYFDEPYAPLEDRLVVVHPPGAAQRVEHMTASCEP